MAKQVINIGTTDNDGTGDSLRAGGDKINDNFDELYAVAPTANEKAALAGNLPSATNKFVTKDSNIIFTYFV